MWETSKMEACVRQCRVESMMESLYWMGIDQPANGTILPATPKEEEEEGTGRKGECY